MEDRELMLRVRAGDDAAFECLVVRYQDRLVNFLYRVVGDAEEAEDLAQEAFLRAYRARKRYEPVAQFSTWLYRIAHNLALSYHRRRARHRLGLLAELPAANPSPDVRLISQETVRRLWDALDALPANQRTALVLTRFEECSYARAARIMNTTTAAVRSLVARARETVRRRLRTIMEARVAEEA
jgi:RNA polymerase sigma-70 factor (ECF subfamily)